MFHIYHHISLANPEQWFHRQKYRTVVWEREREREYLLDKTSDQNSRHQLWCLHHITKSETLKIFKQRETLTQSQQKKREILVHTSYCTKVVCNSFLNINCDFKWRFRFKKKFTHNFVCKRMCVIDIAIKTWGGRKQGGGYTKENTPQIDQWNK